MATYLIKDNFATQIFDVLSLNKIIYFPIKNERSPFWNCVVSKGIASKGEGVVVKACLDGLGHFFSTFACLKEGGGSKDILAMPI